MITAPVSVHVADHSFGLFDPHEIPIDTADWSNGLIVTMSSGAMVYTGIDRGYVRVSIELRTTAPETIDPGPWDDIVETTVVAPYGRLCVERLEHNPDEPAQDLPLLSTQGPGSYRLRAHVRGRDLHYDAVQTEPTEDYLLTIWPAQAAPQLIIRATDQCGYGLRLSDTQRPRPMPPSAPQPELVARDAHRAQLRQALIDTRNGTGTAGQPDRQPPS